MINVVTTQEGLVVANGFKLVDLTKPFHEVKSISQCKKNGTFNREPSETLSTDRLLYYHCTINDQYCGRLAKIYSRDGLLKCHGLYETKGGISKLLRIRALSSMMNKECNGPYTERSSLFISTIVNLLVKSENFQVVLKDFSIDLDINIPVESCEWSFVDPNIDGSVEKRLLATLVKQHGEVPLSVFDRMIYRLPVESTNIDLSKLEDYDRILLLSATNGFYASYLAKLLYKVFPEKEILPLTLFVF